MPRDVAPQVIQRGRVLLMPRTKRAAQDLLADEFIHALRSRPDTFTKGEAGSLLYDTRSGMYWYVAGGPLLLTVGRLSCGCFNLGIGLRNKFRAWRAYREWRDRDLLPSDAPHVHEAIRLARANDM